MKQIILILFLLTVTLFANDIDERKIDIYFGNGVWNSEADAKKGQAELQTQIDDKIINNQQQPTTTSK